MHIPAHNSGKTGHRRNSFVFGITVAICLQYYRGTLDVFFKPPDRTDILCIVCFQERCRIQSFVLGRIQHLSEPGIYALTKISAGPQKKGKSDHTDRLEDLLAVYKQLSEDHIHHRHSKHDVCLISQLEHGICTGISVLIDITDINQFRDRHKSDRAQSHDHCKKIRCSDRFHQAVQRFVI